MKTEKYILIPCGGIFVRIFDKIKKEFVTRPISPRTAERLLKHD